MQYFYIVLVIILVLSPLVWMRPSPGQMRRSRFRQRARELGLTVQLVPAVDASPDAQHPDSVRYLLPLKELPGIRRDDREWILFRSQRRGWPSPWKGWRWLKAEAPERLHPALATGVADLPADADAICRDIQGISVYWLEQGPETDLDIVCRIIKLIEQSDINNI